MLNEESQLFPGTTHTNTEKKGLFFVALAGTSAGRAREKEKATDILAKQMKKWEQSEKEAVILIFLPQCSVFTLTLFLSLSINFLFPCVYFNWMLEVIPAAGSRRTWMQY